MKRTDSSLVYGTSSLGELLLTAIPNHDTLTIWYQIDQCHFAYTSESLVLSLKLCGLWLKQAHSQPATNCRLMEGKLSIGLFSPSLVSFNYNSIARNFALQSFSKIGHRICIWSPLIIEPRSTCSQADHSDYSITEPIDWELLIIFTLLSRES